MNWTQYAPFLGVAVLILVGPGPSLAYAVALASRGSRQELLLNAVGGGS
jgi:threonine/homoserine/homoserine lactone efflux protein